jgi:hypothetical protein
MKPTAALILLFAVALAARAHRLDEYLQATRIGVAMNRIDLSIDLTPGVAIFGTLLPNIDLDGNHRISRHEQELYARRVLTELQLELDGKRQSVELVQSKFPSRHAMETGEGVIHLQAVAKIPSLSLDHHELLFRNLHLPDISVYQVNALVPETKTIHILRQERDERQTEYKLTFEVQRATP